MNTRDASGFSITPYMQRVMDINGCYASIMRTEKKKEESDGGLPSGIPIPVLPVDYLKDRPKEWVGGEGSYVVPVDSDWGLWFNWTMNNPMNTSVLVSVKGMNPLTGQRMNGYTLEETKEECPVHKTPFKKGKLCTECGFKWPAQNFVSAPNPLWIDGFRQADGTVRQFFFTEDMACSIPELVIGKEDTVPAFGFCFYRRKKYEIAYEGGKRSKNEFPEIYTNGTSSCYLSPSCDSFEYERRTLGVLGSSTSFVGGLTGPMGVKGPMGVRGKYSKGLTKSYLSAGEGSSDAVYSASCYTAGAAAASSEPELRAFYADSDTGHTINLADSLGGALEDRSEVKIYRSAEVGIGAGAKINQDFKKSMVSLEDWKDKPEGTLRLYFVFQEQFEAMAESGFNDLSGAKEGYLANLPVGGSK